MTSNLNRHVKNQHADAYREWLNQLNDLKDKDQKKISDVFVRSIGSTRTISSLKSFYAKDHPQQIELSKFIVQHLIIDLDLPLLIVERESFLKFMNTVDPKFTMTSRRTLTRSTILRVYSSMNDQLKRFCHQSQFISLTWIYGLIVV